MIYFVCNSDKRREEKHESDCLCVGHTKLKLWTMLLANLWPEIDRVKGKIWDVAFHKNCRIGL